MRKIIVMGGSGGLGSAVMKVFADSKTDGDLDLINWSFDTGVDVGSQTAIQLATDHLDNIIISGIINCAGINLLREFDRLTADEVLRVMTVNAFSLPMVVRTLRAFGRLESGAAICNVISNAAHIPMTHSLAYNASKAAQEMITRQMARELKGYTIFGVNPNKLAGTQMSSQIEAEVLKLRGWSAEEARGYQLAALPAGVETPVDSLAAFIYELMRPIHHPYITGCIFPYGGPQ